MTRFAAIAALLCLAATASARPVDVYLSLIPLELGFTSTLTPEPTDIWGIVVSDNSNTDPIFTMDLAIPGNFVQSEGAPTVAPGSGSILVAGVLPAADTYFSVPEGIDTGNIAIAPGTAIDNGSLISAAYTVTGDTPILAPGQNNVVIATLASPSGTVPSLPLCLGTAAVRTANGPVSVQVGSLACPPEPIVPEPTAAVLVGLGFAASAARRHTNRPSCT